MFNAVIFDWDGTLADTHRVVVNSFQTVLREVGCKVSDQFIQRKIGIGPRNTFVDALKTTKIPYTDKTIARLIKKKIEIQMEQSESVTLFEGTYDLLDSLHGQVRIALASMNNRSVINKLLEKKRIRKYFDVVITTEEVRNPKPDPEIFIKCAAKLKCRPDRCVVVEDSIFGIKAAKEAKMKCIAIPTGAYSIEALEGQTPNLIVDSLSKKEDILNFILSEDR